MPPMSKPPQYGVQYLIETLANVLGQKTQNKIPVLLKQGVFATVPAVRFGR